MLIEHAGKAPQIDPSAYVAPNATLSGDVTVGPGARVMFGAVLTVNSALPDDEFVPIGWVAVGDPAQSFPPERHDEIWAIQRELNFVGTVMGAAPGTPLPQAMKGYADRFSAHRDDRVVG